jgi:hypothetical protein
MNDESEGKWEEAALAVVEGVVPSLCMRDWKHYEEYQLEYMVYNFLGYGSICNSGD